MGLGALGFGWGLMDFETKTEQLWVLCPRRLVAGASCPLHQWPRVFDSLPAEAPSQSVQRTQACTHTCRGPDPPRRSQVRHLPGGPGSRWGRALAAAPHHLPVELTDACSVSGLPSLELAASPMLRGSIQPQGCLGLPTLPLHPLGRWAAASGEPGKPAGSGGVLLGAQDPGGRLRGLRGQGLGSRVGHSHTGSPGPAAPPSHCFCPVVIAKTLPAGRACTSPPDTDGPLSQPRVTAGLRWSQQSGANLGTGAPPAPQQVKMEGGLGLGKQAGVSSEMAGVGDRPEARLALHRSVPGVETCGSVSGTVCM